MDNYRLLMEQVARLYDKYEAGRPQPFNIFSALHRESDEVNLHSRFLHALLDYKRPDDETRGNLADFLRHVGVGNFEQHGVEVKREKDNIDILITTKDRQHAVAIENKIGAGDRPRQLCRYYNELKDKGYVNIHLLYLTLNGGDPSKASFCGAHCEARSHYETISYKDTLPSWSERCQQRAYDKPGLRESIAQYRQLVQKLTGTDFEGAYMNELTKLCLEDGNLVLVHDLNKAMIQAKIHLLKQLWCEIATALHAEIPALPPVDEADEPHRYASEQRIKYFFTGAQKLQHGLFYPLGGGAFLGVEADGDRLIFGVACSKKNHLTRYNELRQALANVAGGGDSSWWSWYQVAAGLKLKNATRDDLRRLSNEVDRMEHAQTIAQALGPVWEAVQAAGLYVQHE